MRLWVGGAVAGLWCAAAAGACTPALRTAAASDAGAANLSGGDGGATDADPVDATTDAGPVAPVVELRPLAPISGSSAISARPRLRWQPPTGGGTAQVQICADRSCSHVIADFTSDKSEAIPAQDLPPGYWFWRVRSNGRQTSTWTPSWQVRVRPQPFRNTPPPATPGMSVAVDTFDDFNGDGYPDAAVGGAVSLVYLGGADGIAADRVLPFGTPSSGRGETFLRPGADVNGDGFTDLAAEVDVTVPGQDWPDRVAVVQFGGAGGFNVSTASINVITDFYPLWVGEPLGVGDFDGDGFGDLLVTARYGAMLLRGGAPAPPSDPWGVLGCGNCQNQQVATGDFDGDGRSDVIFGDGGELDVFPGNAAGIAPSRIPTWGDVTVIDFDRDGYSDLLLRDETSGDLSAYKGGPAGLSLVPVSEPLPSSFVLAGDFNGDGYWDLMGTDLYRTPGQPMSVTYGAPSGWQSSATIISALDRVVAPSSAAVVDLNGDGYDDLLVAGPDPTTISFYAGSVHGLASTPTKVIAR